MSARWRTPTSYTFLRFNFKVATTFRLRTTTNYNKSDVSNKSFQKNSMVLVWITDSTWRASQRGRTEWRKGGGDKETGASRLRPKSATDPVEWKNMFDDDDALVSVSVKLAAGPAAMAAAELVILYILGLRLSDQHQFPFNAPSAGYRQLNMQWINNKYYR